MIGARSNPGDVLANTLGAALGRARPPRAWIARPASGAARCGRAPRRGRHGRRDRSAAQPALPDTVILRRWLTDLGPPRALPRPGARSRVGDAACPPAGSTIPTGSATSSPGAPGRHHHRRPAADARPIFSIYDDRRRGAPPRSGPGRSRLPLPDPRRPRPPRSAGPAPPGRARDRGGDDPARVGAPVGKALCLSAGAVTHATSDSPRGAGRVCSFTANVGLREARSRPGWLAALFAPAGFWRGRAGARRGRNARRDRPRPDPAGGGLLATADRDRGRPHESAPGPRPDEPRPRRPQGFPPPAAGQRG